MPFSLLYGFVYQLGITYLSFRLRAIKSVRGLYLSGSAAIPDMCHGISDVDFFIVIGVEDRDNTTARTAIRAALKDVIGFFPFMGPYQERRDGVIVVDENGEVDLSIASYRRKTCLFKKVFERRDFKFRTDEPITPLDILAELNNLVARLVIGMRDRRRDAYFWKSKIRSLFVAMFDETSPFPWRDELKLSKEEKELLRYLWGAPNFRLVLSLDEKKLALSYRVFWKLVNMVIEMYGLDALPETTVSYSIQRMVRIRNHQYEVRARVLEHIGVSDLDSAGLAVLDDLPSELGSVKLDEADYHDALIAILESEKIEYPINFQFRRFTVRSFGREAGSGNIFTAPFAFASDDKKTLLVKTVALDRMIEQGSLAKRELLERYREFESKSDAKCLNDNCSGEPHLLVGEDDYQVISSLIDCLRLSGLTKKSIRLYRSKEELFAELVREFPHYQDFLSQLERYFGALKRQDSHAFNDLPSNMFGFMVKFFLAVLSEDTLPPLEELYKRLSLSVCICTRDRPEMLAELLSSVLAQTRKPEEVVIVDNSQSRETASVVRRFADKLPIKYLQEANATLPALRNKAIAASREEIICFTDDDCVLDRNWLAAVERSFLRSEEIGAVGGVVRHQDTQSGTLAELFYREYLGRAY